MTHYAIIVAGGKGLRMGGELPKQFIPVEGRPVLMRTLDAFHACDSSIQIILVLPRDHQPYWHELCRKYDFSVPHRIADGGATRFHSVKSGLALVDAPEALVAVHDGVRPFVSPEVIMQCYRDAETFGAVVPVIPIVETVRQIVAPQNSQARLLGADKPAVVATDAHFASATQGGKAPTAMPASPPLGEDLGGASITVPRDAYRLVQTPQTFRASLLRLAYEQPYCDAFTDDASVVESLGCTVHLTEGNRENIKLTTPYDLIVAKALVNG